MRAVEDSNQAGLILFELELELFSRPAQNVDVTALTEEGNIFIVLRNGEVYLLVILLGCGQVLREKRLFDVYLLVSL